METRILARIEFEDLFSDIIEHLDQGISLFDETLRLVACNKRCRELLNLPDERAGVGTTFADFVRFSARYPRHGLSDLESIVKSRFARSDAAQPLTLERDLPDGMILQIRFAPRPDGGLIGVYTDVSLPRRSEEAVRVAEARYSTLIEQAPISIWEED